jgi:TATA-box binding protein (TBP) (component of TFIID and TFIIIB)
MRHDVAVLDPVTGLTAMDVVIAEQGKLLRPCLAQDAEVLDQAEQLRTPEGQVRVVNKVCTVYARPLEEGEKAREMDEPSDCTITSNDPSDRRSLFKKYAQSRGKKRQVQLRYANTYGDDDDDDDANNNNNNNNGDWDSGDVENGTATRPGGTATRPSGTTTEKKKPALPSLVSLRYLQRRWLQLGYNKNKVGTALSVRYARPVSSTHMAFTTGRFYCVGATNRQNDRAGMYHQTLPYMFRPLSDLSLKPRRYGCTRRISQNIVASQHLPPGTALCLGLFHSRLSSDAKAPQRFKSIVIAHPIHRATLLFYRSNIICVGTSSLEDLGKAYAHFIPIATDCYNTQENINAERELVRRGAVTRHMARTLLGYVVNEQGNIETVYDDDNDNNNNNGEDAEKAQKKATKRRPKKTKKMMKSE